MTRDKLSIDFIINDVVCNVTMFFEPPLPEDIKVKTVLKLNGIEPFEFKQVWGDLTI